MDSLQSKLHYRRAAQDFLRSPLMGLTNSTARARA